MRHDRDDGSVSEHPRHARLSRLDAANWPRGTGTVIFIGWIGYAVASSVWIHPLLWTVLPSGLALYLLAERYPVRCVLLLVVPLAILTALSQVVAGWSAVPTAVAFATYLIGCAYFSFILCVPNRDRLVALLPSPILGERFGARLAWTRFEESLMAANGLVAQGIDVADRDGRHAELRGLATEARRESRRSGPWADAWAAQAGWMEALDELVGVNPSADQVRYVHDLLVALDDAHMLAIEQTSVLDPAP